MFVDSIMLTVLHDMKCHEVNVLNISRRFSSFYISNIFRNTNSNNSVYDCVVRTFGKVCKNRKASFLILGHFHAHHREWLSSVFPADQFGRAT